MAFISTLIAAISRRLASLLRAILGWSVTALFGRLGTARQTALIIIVVFSVFWPVLVTGVFFPDVAAYAVAFLPLHKWIDDDALRVLWLALAIAVPPLVGVATAWIVPADKRKGGLLRTVINGYPMTIGFVVSFVLTAVIVAITKIRTMSRRWIEEHVTVQAEENHFRDVLREVRAACEQAGLEVVDEPVPRSMSLPARVLERLSRGALDPLVPDEPRRLRAPDLEVYLYPADLLLRGNKHRVARVRAEMTRTKLERFAYLVASKDAQAIQHELQRFWEVIERHRDSSELGRAAESRLEELREELRKVHIPFDEWVVLDRMRHRLHDIVRGAVPWPGEGEEREEKVMDLTTEDPSALSTKDLVKRAIEDTRELVRLEVALAKDELKTELADAKKAGIAIGVGHALAIAGIATLCTAVVIALGTTVLAAVVVGTALLALAGIAAGIGYGKAPKKPLDRTRQRVGDEVHQLKERIA